MMSTVPVSTGVPILSSNSTAQAKIYLDFNGEAAGMFNSTSVPPTPAYDVDGDASTFSDAEQANIREIWARVSEKFSPFNVNVTTVNPGSFADMSALRVIVGGNGDWVSVHYGGKTSVGGFYNPALLNTAYVFSDSFSDNPRWTAEAAAMQIGQSFGLYHQSLYGANNVKLAQLNPGSSQGNSAIAPIMGATVGSTRGVWWEGIDLLGRAQNDMALIGGTSNGFGYRADDSGNSISTATGLGAVGSTLSRSGIIENTTDSDFFSFTTAGGQVTINGTGAQYGQMLDVKFQLFNSAGQQVALADSTSLNETLTTTLAAGTYYVAVSSHGMVPVYNTTWSVNAGKYADVGQYTVTVTGTTAPAPTAPAAASGLTATAASASQINLAWVDNSSNETGFEIDRATDSSFASGLSTVTVGAGVSTYSATGLAGATTYYFRVRATNAVGNSANSSAASATTNAMAPAPTAPVAASGLTATAASASQINLAWFDNSSNETGFEIDRATDSSFASGLSTVTVGAGVTTYSATGLASATTYYFRVRATNAVGDSANTSIVFATTAQLPTAPAAASGLTATTASASQINLTWLDNSSNETGFQIERSTSSTFSTVTTVTVGANVQSYSATGLAAGTTYYFRVKATNTVGTAPASNTASAVTSTVAPTPTVPSTPTGLRKSRTGKKTTISWTDTSNSESGFRLQYSKDGVNWISLATLSANQTSYTTSMKNADSFGYRVQAYNTAGNSGWATI